jgi:hypothetical protein
LASLPVGRISCRAFAGLHLGLCIVISISICPAAFAAPHIISTGKLDESYRFTPLEFEIRGVSETAGVGLEAVPSGKKIACQVIEGTKDSVKIAWLADSLEKGGEGAWKMELLPKDAERPKARVEVKGAGEDAIAVIIDGAEFTRLLSSREQFKPYLFPIVGPNGKMITRQYPMVKKLPGEDQDHPHHRSLWFDHGNVNGVDYWAEGDKKGRIRQVEVKSMGGGPVFGRIETLNEWVPPDGKPVLTDERVYAFYPLERGEVLLDISIELKTAGGGDVVFGDTKEGSFGIRLAESMKESRGGTIVSSRGQKGMSKAWGKPAEWVDYSGKVEGDLVGVAILDHPTSFRHPTTWHVRDYGLFAANPFGYKDFKFEGKDGKFVLEKGKSMKLRYRLYFHHGGVDEARVAEVYRGFAAPPPLHPRA